MKYQGNRYINDEAASRKVQLCLRATIPLSVKRDDLNLRGAPVTFTTPQPRFQSFFGGRFFSQNWHFGITKRITKHNFLVLQSTYLYFVSNEDHTFEKKNVYFLLVTSTLKQMSNNPLRSGKLTSINVKQCASFLKTLIEIKRSELAKPQRKLSKDLKNVLIN